jgi:hypothetical protein
MVGNDTRELEKRFFKVGDRVHVLKCDARLLHAEVDRLNGKLGSVLHATESLFLSGGDDLAIADHTGRGVVIKTGDSQYEHGSNPGVDESDDDAGSHLEEQNREQDKRNEDRRHEVELVFANQVSHFAEHAFDFHHLPLMAYGQLSC